MATTRRAALRSANVGDGSDFDLAFDLATSPHNVEATPPARSKQPQAAPKRKAPARARSRPLVVEDDVIIISSDSDDDPPPRKSAAVKSKSQNTSAREKALSQENERLKRQVEQLLANDPAGKGKKRALDVDEDDEQDHERQRLRKKTLEMQAENERVRTKLAASEKELKNLKKELKGKNVNVDGLRQHFECEICMETLWQPWALSDCGHTYCQSCLISLFNAQKFECPTCRVRVQHRPVEVFAFKSLVRAIAGPAPPEVDMLAEGGHIWDPIWPRAGRGHAHHAHAHPR